MFWYLKSKSPVAGPEQMVVQGQSEKLVIHDVYKPSIPDKAPVVINSDRDVLISDTAEHQMIYFAKDQAFTIVITDPDIQRGREISEKAFLENLKIDEEAACKLRVSLGVPLSVNEEASGLNYGLSFCPNGRPFPGQP